ncbi:MAG: amidase family protein, partial [Dongia sp.]
TGYQPIKGWRIAYSLDLGFFEIDREVRKNTLAALDVFRDLGCTVEEVDLGWTRAALDIAVAHLYHIFGITIWRLAEKHGRVMTPYARYFARQGNKSTPEDFLKTMEVAAEMYSTFGPMMEKHDVFICPTVALPAVKADFDHSQDTLMINGKKAALPPYLGWCMTTPFNTLSRCPVLAVPSGHAKNGVPTGMQIVGRTYSDADVFRAAAAYEAAVGGWYRDTAHRPKL